MSYLHVAIATGRTHQIRVHLSAIGHPIVGDPVYGGVRRHMPAQLRSVLRLERPFLHAMRLAFTHPIEPDGGWSSRRRSRPTCRTSWTSWWNECAKRKSKGSAGDRQPPAASLP